jgi:hypothetical protein
MSEINVSEETAVEATETVIEETETTALVEDPAAEVEDTISDEDGEEESEEGIETLSQYMKFVEKLPNEYTLSRGQSSDFPLLPGGLRKDDNGIKKYLRADIQFFLDEFKVNSHNYLPFPWDPKNDWEWMIYAQHYGVPTRLLDFTFSHILSLMFAIENAFSKNQKGNAVVWFLNPKALNSKFCDTSKILNISNETLPLDSYQGPVAIQGRKLNARINSQNGVFVYFQDNENPLEDTVAENQNILRKLVIKEDYLKDIMASLNSMGIGFSHLYPELSSVSKDILMRRNVSEYIKEKEENV